MQLSVGFITGRQEPRLDWALAAIIAGMRTGDEIDVIVVDALHGQRPDVLTYPWPTGMPIGSKLGIRDVPVHPNIWQGPHRITACDWWAAAAARNTVIGYADHDYLVFLDDRCRPGPRWMDTLRHGCETRESVIAGSYDKLEGPEGARTLSHDHRREREPNGKIDCGGTWLYGCTFALPLEWALEVNGLEEGCDSLTGEDYIFGLMLNNAGHRIDFVPELYVLQDRAPGDTTTKGRYPCKDKNISPNDKSHAAIDRFGSRARTEFTPDLTVIRDELAAGRPWPIPDPSYPHRDWYDGELIRDMTPK